MPERPHDVLRRRSLLLAFVACAWAGCATVGEQGQALVPTRYQARTGPFIVFSNAPLAADAPALHGLHSLEADVESALGLRVASEQPAVEVYILNDRESFTHFLRFYYPELPTRRAFFLAQGSRRVVYTFQGERLEEDLRHEATHALLHVAVGDLPLWLDEGLAEYFESPDNRRGLNAEHMSRLPQDVALGWKPDLAKLESLTNVREMTTRDYRESWAWVHFLLNSAPTNKALLLSTLADLRTSPSKAVPLSKRLPAGDQIANASLLAHVEKVRTQPAASAPPAEVTTVRLQDTMPDPAKRSFFGRLRGMFGF
ncbi:MAG: DUF1570 domain-containing protein [Isosphaeraceae bacterium]|nr:DUF1570 domain-containing protein [Isosphaeraceae bacterium]